MSDLNLTSFNPLYPMRIHPYDELLNDQNQNVMDKINSIIDYLNQVGKLTNDVVKNWNTVYQWTMNDGLTTDVNNKLEDMLAKGELNSIIDFLVSKMGDLTALTTSQKDTIVNAINSLKSDLTTAIGLKADQTALVATNANVASNAAQLAQRVHYVTPKEFNAIGDGVADDTTALQNAINYAITNKVRLQGDGKNKIYGISSPLTINDTIDFDLGGATIRALNDMDALITTDTSFYNTYYANPYGHFTLIENLTLDCNFKNVNGIHMIQASKFRVNKVNIWYLKQTGIMIDSGGENFFTDIDILGDASPNSVGINAGTGDCHYTDIYMTNCYTGIICNGTNFFTRVHPWMQKNFNGSIGFLHKGGDAFLNGCYLDSFQYSIKKMCGARLTISQMEIFYNTTLYNPTEWNYPPYVFYFELPSGSNSTLDGYSRMVSVTGSNIACHSTIQTHITNLPSGSSFMQMDNNFIYSGGIWPPDLTENNTVKLVLETTATDTNGSDNLYNQIKLKPNNLARVDLKLYCAAGIPSATSFLVGHIPSTYAQFSGDKFVTVSFGDTAFTSSGTGMLHLTSANNGSFYVRHTLATPPKYLFASFEYEVGMNA